MGLESECCQHERRCYEEECSLDEDKPCYNGHVDRQVLPYVKRELRAEREAGERGVHIAEQGELICNDRS